MIRAALATLCAALWIGIAAPAGAQSTLAPADSDAAPRFFEREVLALMEDAAAAAALAEAAREPGYELLREAPLPALGFHLIAFRFPEGLSGVQAIEGLEALGLGGVIGVNHLYGFAQAGTRAETAAARRDFGPAMVGWPAHGCPVPVKIGLIDAAIGARLQGPGGKALRERSFVEADAAARESMHGAEIASLLIGGGARPGLLPQATLYAAGVAERAANGEAFVRVERLLLALDWLTGEGVKVVNVSLAGPQNRLLNAASKAAEARGVIIVAAAGNSGPDAPPAYPAALPQTLAATAIDALGRPYARSNRGDYVDVAAPGVDVLVGPEAGAPRYRSGTSFAAPFVAAMLAVRLREAGAMDAQALRRVLAENAQDLGEAGPDPVFGVGLMRAPAECRAAR